MRAVSIPRSIDPFPPLTCRPRASTFTIHHALSTIRHSASYRKMVNSIPVSAGHLGYLNPPASTNALIIGQQAALLAILAILLAIMRPATRPGILPRHPVASSFSVSCLLTTVSCPLHSFRLPFPRQNR